MRADVFQSISILGVRVHMVQTPQVLEIIGQWISHGREPCRWIVVTGMHGVEEARKDAAFRGMLNSADLFVPDGISLVLIARRRGFPLKRRVSGPDLFAEFCAVADKAGYRNFFFGDTDVTLRLLEEQLKAKFPGLSPVGFYSPPFRPLSQEEDEAVVRMINDSKPDVLWVALGCPKQERWIYEHRDRLHVPVAIGIGAAFKFMGGTVERAPEWVGNLGFEWLWRFVHEPHRLWRRVLIDGPRFVFSVGLEELGIKKFT